MQNTERFDHYEIKYVASIYPTDAPEPMTYTLHLSEVNKPRVDAYEGTREDEESQGWWTGGYIEAMRLAQTLHERWGVPTYVIGMPTSYSGLREGAIVESFDAYDAGVDAETKCAYCHAPVRDAENVPAAHDDEAWQAEAAHHEPTCEWVATRAHTREARAILINDRAITITAEECDHGYAPEARDVEGNSVYLSGEDDEDDATPAEALARGERYLHEQAERGNL